MSQSPLSQIALSQIPLPQISRPRIPPSPSSLCRKSRSLAAVCLSACLLVLSAAPALAEDITWPGNGQLRNTDTVVSGGIPYISGVADSLFPDANSPSGNTVRITGGSPIAGTVFGGLSQNAAVQGNSVFVSGGAINRSVVGGFSYAGDAVGNSVSISDGGIGSIIFGGYSAAGNVTGNSVSISGGNISDTVFGGYIFDGPGNVTGNSVSISGGNIPGAVFGGFINTGPGNVTGNQVIVSNGTLRQNVFGGGITTGNGNVAGNTLTISNGDMYSDASGGVIMAGNGSVTGNRVIVSNGTLRQNVFGGGIYIGSGSATANTVAINSGTIIGDVFGGYISTGSGSGSVTNNQVTIRDGIIGENVSGGYISTGSGNVTNNQVTISGGGIGGEVRGGYIDSGSGNVANNQVIISGGNIPDTVFGGSINTGTGDVTGNSVSVSNGTLSVVLGGASYGGDATRNTVTISGGLLQGGAIGGSSVTGNAAHNQINISGGKVVGVIFGGASGSGNATYNTVTLSGNPDLSTALLFGGQAGRDTFTGNTLNLHGYQGRVAGLQNFDILNFVLPASMRSGDTQLTVTGAAVLVGVIPTSPPTLRNSTVNVGILGGGSALAKGDAVRLIGGPVITVPDYIWPQVQGLKGVSLLYDFDLETRLGPDGGLWATVAGVRANPRAAALSEGRLAGQAILNQGADLIIGPGLAGILGAARGRTEGAPVAFLTGSGGWSRYDTGSHIDVSGASILTGLAWRQDVSGGESGSFLAGLFFEAGWGGYDSYNSFTNFASVDGDGDISYYGGGVLGRYDLAPTGPGNIYVDASFRIGHVSTDFDTSDLRDLMGRKVDYDSGSAYYGAHAGLGYLWNLNERADLDLSTRYIWTHQDSDTVSVTGDSIDFDAIDSHRWRTGARFSYDLFTEGGSTLTPYVGAYYDHEFDGEADASAYGYAFDSPDLTGGTGVGELGLAWQPANTNLSLDVGVQGYLGVREGVTGSLQVKYEF